MPLLLPWLTKLTLLVSDTLFASCWAAKKSAPCPVTDLVIKSCRPFSLPANVSFNWSNVKFTPKPCNVSFALLSWLVILTKSLHKV